MQWYTIRAEGNSLFFLMEKRPRCSQSVGRLVSSGDPEGESLKPCGTEVPVQLCAKAAPRHLSCSGFLV